jgi:hypothetical protein
VEFPVRMSGWYVVGSGALALVICLFGLAGLEKGNLLRTRTARWHPILMVSPRTRRWADPLITMSLLMDVAAITLLLLNPRFGAAISMGLVAIYTLAALATSSGNHTQSCRCFYKVLDTRTRAALVFRNISLVACLTLIVATEPSLSIGGCFVAIPLGVLLFLSVRFVDTRAAGSTVVPSVRSQEGASL